MRLKLLILIFLTSGCLFGQYPSDARLLADVKSQNPTEFAEIKFLGNWFMAHDRVPDWQPPDAAKRELSIKGKVNSAGEWWEYFGLAIYHKAGNQFAFNRVFINEDPKLKGVKLPEDNYFKELFMKELKSKNSMLMSMNYVLANATNFYSFELGEKPWVTGNHTERFVYFIIDVTLDVVNGYNLDKKKIPIEVKVNKTGDTFSFAYAMPKNDGALISCIKYPNSDIVDELMRFGYDQATRAGKRGAGGEVPRFDAIVVPDDEVVSRREADAQVAARLEEVLAVEARRRRVGLGVRGELDQRLELRPRVCPIPLRDQPRRRHQHRPLP